MEDVADKKDDITVAEETENTQDINDTKDNDFPKENFFKKHKKLLIIAVLLIVVGAGIFFVALKKKAA